MPDKHNNKIGNNEIGNGFDADLHSYRLVQRNCPCLGKLLTTRPECAKTQKYPNPESGYQKNLTV